MKARIAGRVSVYRILETGDDARVRLLDILDGTEYEVLDRSFAAMLDEFGLAEDDLAGEGETI